VLTPTVLARLQSREGQELLALATENVPDVLRASDILRRHAEPEMAAAALTQVVLRQGARAKFERAAEMFFDRVLLEQASDEIVSRWRARRFAGRKTIADLCCGLGGDTIGLASGGGELPNILAVDLSPLAVRLAALNIRAYGLSDQVLFAQAAVPRVGIRADAAFIDPSRRHQSIGNGSARRTRRLAEMSPSISDVLTILGDVPDLAMKLSPATSHSELDWFLRSIEHEREFVSVRGECRECVVWTGTFVKNRRSATMLPGGLVLAGQGDEKLDIHAPGCYLYEPDAAVIRAGLVARLANEIGAWGLSRELAYLSSDRLADTPLGSAFRLLEVQPFSRKALIRMLRERGVTDPVVKTRAFAVSTEEVRSWMRPHGRGGVPAVVFLTRIGNRPMMMLGERVGPGTG